MRGHDQGSAVSCIVSAPVHKPERFLFSIIYVWMYIDRRFRSQVVIQLDLMHV